MNLQELKKNTQEINFGLYYKDQAVQQILPYIQGNKYNISFDIHNIHPSGNVNDPLIELRVPPKEGDIQIKEIGVHIPSELQK